MPARITVRAELQSLLSKSQALTDANRLAQLDAERRRREELAQLAAKRRQADEEATRRKQLEDPVGRNRLTAAMGQRALEKFSGYFMREFFPDSLRITLRSGVKATVGNLFYSSVEDSPGYANQSDSATFPSAVVDFTPTFLQNCPEYAAILAEVEPLTGIADLLGPDDSWFVGAGWYEVKIPFLSIDNFSFYELVETPSGGFVPRATKVRDVSQLSATGLGFVNTNRDFAFTSYRNQDGTSLPRGRFVYVRGYENTKRYNAGNFTGFVTEYDQIWQILFGVLVRTETRREVKPATGSWPAASSTAGPSTAAWIIAESANVPATQSVIEASASGLNVEQAFAGNFSSWPGAGQGGAMSELLPPSGISGGGSGGEE
jgi:hypothetical protein